MSDEFERPLPRGVIRSKSTASAGNSAERTLIPERQRTTDQNPPIPPRSHPTGRGTITAIEPQSRQEHRVNIFVDGTFAIGLFEDIAVALNLKVGQVITPERLTELAALETRRKAREDAYRLLSYRARTEREIRDRLHRNNYEEDVIEETIRYLYDQRLLDDADFANRMAISRSKTHGQRAIAMQLRQKGVAAETVQEVMAEAVDTETQRDTARSLAIRRVGERPTDTTPAAKARLSAFLARRGFDWETIRPVLTELYGSTSEDEENDEG